jgi:hypothetical protein
MPKKKKADGGGRKGAAQKASSKAQHRAGESGCSNDSDEDEMLTAAGNARQNTVVRKGSGHSHTATGASSSKASAGPAQARAPAPAPGMQWGCPFSGCGYVHNRQENVEQHFAVHGKMKLQTEQVPVVPERSDAGAGGQNPRSSGAGMRHDSSDDDLDTAGGSARKKAKSQSVAGRKRGPSAAAQAADDRSKRLQELDQYGPADFAGRLVDAAADAKFRQGTKQSVRKFVAGTVAPVRGKPGSLASRTMLMDAHMPYADEEHTSDEDEGQEQGLQLSRSAVRFQVQYAHNVVAAWSRGLLTPTRRKLSDTIERTVSLALILYGPTKYTTTLDQHKASLHEPFLSDSHEKTQTPRSRWRRAFIAASAATQDFGTPKVCMQRVMGSCCGVDIVTCTCR